MPTERRPPQRREIGWEELGALLHQLALRASEEGPFEAVVGVVRGGAIVGASLSFLLGCDFYPIQLKKGRGANATRVVVSPPADVAGRRVLLVDDMSLSGDTFRIARIELARVGAAEVRTAALLRRKPGFTPDLWASEVTGKVRLPWARYQLVDGELAPR